jgi:hypothetical protein
MLDLAGAHGLARAVETERVAIDQAAAQVAGLLRWAQEDATRRRNGATAS